MGSMVKRGESLSIPSPTFNKQHRDVLKIMRLAVIAKQGSEDGDQKM